MITIIISFLILEIISKKDHGLTIRKYFNLKNYLSIAVIVTFLVALIARRIKLNIKKENLISQDAAKFTDTWNIADDYMSMYLVESVLFGLIIVKLLAFFDINLTARLLYQSLYTAFQMFFIFLVIFLLSMAVFSAISHIIWGPYIEDFSQLDISFVYILMMSIGYFDFSKFLQHEQHIAVFFISCFFLLLISVAYSAYISFYAEGLRLSVKKLGYPNEVENNKWKLKDYIQWITNIKIKK
jgi:hypothetical protein